MTEAFVNYSDYTSEYKGILIPKDSFNRYALKASNEVNYFTFGRINIDNVDDELLNNIIFATCESADFIYSQDKLKEEILISSSKEKASETVGPHSVSYVNKTNIKDKHILSNNELRKECYQICYKYLSMTGLMNRGIY